MRSVRTEAFWQTFRRHEGLNSAHYEATQFRTPPDVADSLLNMMLAGAMRATVGPTQLFGDGREEPLPEAGDYAVLLDIHHRPQLIWRTTGTTVGPLSSVTNEFVWRSGQGTGEREDWLTRIGQNFTRNAKVHGFEMHPDIETVFETLEVVWPDDVARRIRLVTPHLDRGIALLQRMNEQRSNADGLEAILARIQTAVLTVTPKLHLCFTNPAAETMLRRGDGLLVKNGRLTTRRQADERQLAAAVFEVCRQPTIAGSPPPANRRTGVAAIVPIGRDEEQPPYRAGVFRLRRDHAARALISEAEGVLFVDDPNDDAAPAQADLYSRAFLLTPAEARLAVHLASGASLTEAADEFGVTHNTVRAQLRAVFDKTDTHRQTELVRLLQTSRSLRVSLS